MLINYSKKYKFIKFLHKVLFGEKNNLFLFDKPACSCMLKILLVFEGKVLLAKQASDESLSKSCIPYGYLDIETGEDNASACERIAFERMNINLDKMFFDSKGLKDILVNYKENGDGELVYIYKYNISEEEFRRINQSYIFYEFFLLDLDELKEYKNKKRFLHKFDYLILDNFKKDLKSHEKRYN